MKFNWKILLEMALPFVKAAGQAKIDEDENTVGKDDAIGISILYGVELFKAIISGRELPKAPKELR